MMWAVTDGASIVPSGNTNIGELNDPVVNNLFNKANNTPSAAGRATIWGQIDHQVMSDAVILPEVYAKSLIYRDPSLTNVYVQSYYGMYDYAALGAAK